MRHRVMGARLRDPILLMVWVETLISHPTAWDKVWRDSYVHPPLQWEPLSKKVWLNVLAMLLVSPLCNLEGEHSDLRSVIGQRGFQHFQFLISRYWQSMTGKIDIFTHGTMPCLTSSSWDCWVLQTPWSEICGHRNASHLPGPIHALNYTCQSITC